jgi:hypothetical protein
MSLLPGRQTGEAWEPSKQHCSFRHHGQKDRQVVSFFIYFSLRRVKELKHFIIQQMHKYIIRRYNKNYYKIFKNI